MTRLILIYFLLDKRLSHHYAYVSCRIKVFKPMILPGEATGRVDVVHASLDNLGDAVPELGLALGLAHQALGVLVLVLILVEGGRGLGLLVGQSGALGAGRGGLGRVVGVVVLDDSGAVWKGETVWSQKPVCAEPFKMHPPSVVEMSTIVIVKKRKCQKDMLTYVRFFRSCVTAANKATSKKGPVGKEIHSYSLE